MKIGVVGKPSSGKSTFLNAACLTDAEMAAYPFTTIKPNLGTAVVRSRCPCVDLGVKHCDGNRLVPIPLVDVAGLVPGAHLGKGMGNQFLNDLADADALIHVVDASGRLDESGNPGKGDPATDVTFLEAEIEQWMLGILLRNWTTTKRRVEMGADKLDTAICSQLSGLKVTEDQVKRAIRELGLTYKSSDEDLLKLIHAVRKPILVAANKMDLPESAANIDRIAGAIPCCAEAELALRRAARAGLIEYAPGAGDFKVLKQLNPAQEHGLELIRKLLKQYGSTGVQGVIDAATYKLLDLIVVYPVEDEHKLTDKKGRVLPDAHLLPRGSTALDLARKVHTELAEKFIGAIDVRTKKRVGRDHVLRDGDVIRILV